MSNITAEAENENMSAPQRPMLKAYRKYDAEYRRYFQEQMHKLSSDGNNVIMTKGIPLSKATEDKKMRVILLVGVKVLGPRGRGAPPGATFFRAATRQRTGGAFHKEEFQFFEDHF